MREGGILREENPIHRLVGNYIIVGPNQVGILECDGIVRVLQQGRHRVPKGMVVRCYKASTAPFTVVFWLRDPDDPTEPTDGVALDMPVLTRDGQPVTGRISLELRAMPDKVEYLMQLIPQGGGSVDGRAISDLIKDELLAKVLALDLHRYTAMELRGNESPLRDIHGSVIRELESTISRYGLRCDNFYTAWGLSAEEHEGIKDQRHKGTLRDIQRQREREEALGRGYSPDIITRHGPVPPPTSKPRPPKEIPEPESLPPHGLVCETFWRQRDPNDDRRFQEWMRSHPRGFVFNHFRGGNPVYNLLHQLPCPSFQRQANAAVEKFCSTDRASIVRTIKEHRGDNWQLCGNGCCPQGS